MFGKQPGKSSQAPITAKTKSPFGRMGKRGGSDPGELNEKMPDAGMTPRPEGTLEEVEKTVPGVPSGKKKAFGGNQKKPWS